MNNYQILEMMYSFHLFEKNYMENIPFFFFLQFKIGFWVMWECAQFCKEEKADSVALESL
jgi:hypothetical protein